MNKQTIEGNWLQLRGKIRETWGQLTADDVDIIAGKRDRLVGKLQERYGKAAEVIEEEIAAFERSQGRDD